MEPIAPARLTAAKKSYAVRRVNFADYSHLATKAATPKPGDIVLARVQTLGSHKRIELPNGRKATLHKGDEVLLAFGNRYAPDQYEAYVPEALEPCHMVAAGGIAAKAASWHDKLSGPTGVEPVGILCRADGTALNLADYAVPTVACSMPSTVFGVFGTSMNAGKTATAASLVRGFAKSGYKVGALKITGTAAGGDPWLMHDSGAAEVLDFTDGGLATTFGTPLDKIVATTRNLLRTLYRSQCDVAVVEIADGLFQDETRQIASSPLMHALFDGVVFAAGDALGAVAGVNSLQQLDYRVLGVSGAVMQSPLAVREIVMNVDVPAFSLADLQNPTTVSGIMEQTLSGQLAVAQ
ncbi:MAG: molybdopterin guanine dinucleotide synthesis B family protein [Pseudomonadota bacterium]